MALFAAMALGAAAPESSGRARLEAEYPAASRKLEAFYTRLKMSGRSVKDEGRFEVGWEFLADAGSRRWVAVNRRDRSSTVMVVDPKLSFKLMKAPGASEYVLTTTGRHAPGQSGNLTRAIRLQATAPCAPYCIFESTIRDFMAEETFRIKTVTESEDPAGKVVRVDWENSVPSQDLDRQGSFLFTPENCWALRGYEYLLKERDSTTGKRVTSLRSCTIEYDGVLEGIPLVRTMQFRTLRLPRPPRDAASDVTPPETVIEVAAIVPGSTPPEAFRPEAFGVSYTPAVAPSRRVYYSLAAAASFGLLAGAFRLLGRRMARSTATA